MYQLAQVPLNLPMSRNVSGEMHELFGKVSFRHNAGYSLILASY